MAESTSPWKLGGLSVKELGLRVYREATADEIFDRGAGLAYYLLFALFPGLLFLTTLLGLLPIPDLMERLRQDADIARLISELQGFVDQINSHGCVCKGIEQGLIDFPCVLGSEVVFLCWQLGEPQVGYWHRIEDGFAGRKPLLDQEADDDEKLSYH